jgi:uncharacterized protein with HEPN domain
LRRDARQRLDDILVAIDAIRAHLERGDLSDGLVFDAVRVRLIEIGEAIKTLPADLVDSEPGIPWAEVAQMRDRLAHHYFDTSHAVVTATVQHDLPVLETAVRKLMRTVGASS